MSKNYFFKSVKNEAGNIFIYPVENQTIETSSDPVDVTLKVSSPTETRISHPVGSLFVGTKLSLSSTGTFYHASGFEYVNPDTEKGKRLLKEYLELSKKDMEKKTTTTTTTTKPKTLFEEIIADDKLVCPTSMRDGFYMSSDDWSILVRNIKKHINTMIVGPTGCGKTSAVKEVCDRLGIPLYTFDMGTMIDPISSLLGVHRLEEGKSVFDYAKFTQVIQKPCVILFDELNRASLACNNVLFPCLDDRRSLSIEVASGRDTRDIKVHPEVTFIATANIGSEYSGTNTIDRALLDRFFPLELGVIPTSEEELVLQKRCGVTPEKSRIIVKIANNIRSLARKQEVSTTLSIRETLMVSNLVADGWDMGKAMQMIYLPLYEGTKSEGERSTIYKTLSSY